MMHHSFRNGSEFSMREHRLIFQQSNTPPEDGPASAEGPKNERKLDELVRKMLEQKGNKEALHAELLNHLMRDEEFKRMTEATALVKARISKLPSIRSMNVGELHDVLDAIPTDPNSFIRFAETHNLFTSAELSIARFKEAKRIGAEGAQSDALSEQGYVRPKPKPSPALSAPVSPESVVPAAPMPSYPPRRRSHYDKKSRMMIHENEDGTVTYESIDQIRARVQSQHAQIQQFNQARRNRSMEQGRLVQNWRSNPIGVEHQLNTQRTARQFGITPNEMYNPMTGTDAAFLNHVNRGVKGGNPVFMNRSGSYAYIDNDIPRTRIDPRTGLTYDARGQYNEYMANNDPRMVLGMPGARILSDAPTAQEQMFNDARGIYKQRSEAAPPGHITPFNKIDTNTPAEQRKLVQKYQDRLVAEYPAMRDEFNSYAEMFRDDPQFGTSYRRWDAILSDPENLSGRYPLYSLLTQFRTQLEAYRKAADVRNQMKTMPSMKEVPANQIVSFDIPAPVANEWDSFRIIVSKIDGDKEVSRIVYYPGTVEQFDDSASLENLLQEGISIQKTMSGMANRDGKKKVTRMDVGFTKDGLYKVRLSSGYKNYNQERMIQIGEKPAVANTLPPSDGAPNRLPQNPKTPYESAVPPSDAASNRLPPAPVPTGRDADGFDVPESEEPLTTPFKQVEPPPEPQPPEEKPKGGFWKNLFPPKKPSEPRPTEKPAEVKPEMPPAPARDADSFDLPEPEPMQTPPAPEGTLPEAPIPEKTDKPKTIRKRGKKTPASEQDNPIDVPVTPEEPVVETKPNTPKTTPIEESKPADALDAIPPVEEPKPVSATNDIQDYPADALDPVKAALKLRIKEQMEQGADKNQYFVLIATLVPKVDGPMKSFIEGALKQLGETEEFNDRKDAVNERSYLRENAETWLNSEMKNVFIGRVQYLNDQIGESQTPEEIEEEFKEYQSE